MPAASTRRRWLRTASAATISPLILGGCESVIGLLLDTCPSDPAESGEVNWIPDILHPVFWGYADHDLTTGAPRPLRIHYPTYDGTPQHARMLKQCIARYPVVLFLHGQGPCRGDANYYRRWMVLPRVLARSGYVVVVPQHNADLPGPDSPEIAQALEVLDWVRGGWEHRQWLDARPEGTVVGGHSYGALLAARVRQARPAISAFVSLSAEWWEVDDGQALLSATMPPSFHAWATADGNPISESLDGLLWSLVAAEKHAAIFPGTHFDYLGDAPDSCYTFGCPYPPPPCSYTPGHCALVAQAIADLVALFIARHVPVSVSNLTVSRDLKVEPATLTPQQEFFAGSASVDVDALFKNRFSCRLDLRWEESGGAKGTRHIGS